MERTWVIPVLASILILGSLGLTQDAFAETFTLLDQASCDTLEEVFRITTWSDSTCTVEGNIFVDPGDEFVIPEGVTLNFVQDAEAGQAVFENRGSVTNNGIVIVTMDKSIFFTNVGSISNFGVFVNNGKISMSIQSFTVDFPSSFRFTNFGTFINHGLIEMENHNSELFEIPLFSSDGELVNSCTAEIRLGQNSAETINVDISGNFKNGGLYLGPADPDIQDFSVFCNIANNTIDALTAENISLRETIDELLANAFSTFSTAFVQPILNAVDALISSGDIDASEEGSLTRTLDRSLTTAERADGVACTRADSLLVDVNNLIATTSLTEFQALDLLDRVNDLIDSCTP